MTKILHIEDDEDIQALVAEILQDEGAEVDVTAIGEDGIRMAVAKNYDLIICDGKVEGQIPYAPAILADIQHNRGGNMPPVLVISAGRDSINDILAMKENGQLTGSVETMSKPFSFKTLIQTIQTLVPTFGEPPTTGGTPLPRPNGRGSQTFALRYA